MLINGEIAMLAGYIAICATDVNGDNPEATASTDDNDTPDNADITVAPKPATDDPTDDPTDDTHPVNPDKLNGGISNCAIVEATAADVV